MPPQTGDFETDGCPVHRDDRPIACAPVRLEARGLLGNPQLLSPAAVPPGGSEGGSVGPEPPPGIKTPFLFGAPPEKNDFPPVPTKAGNLGLKRPQITGQKWISVHPNHRAGALGSCSRVVVTNNRPVSHRRSRRGCFPKPWVAAPAATQGNGPANSACSKGSFPHPVMAMDQLATITHGPQKQS